MESLNLTSDFSPLLEWPTDSLQSTDNLANLDSHLNAFGMSICTLEPDSLGYVNQGSTCQDISDLTRPLSQFTDIPSASITPIEVDTVAFPKFLDDDFESYYKNESTDVATTSTKSDTNHRLNSQPEFFQNTHRGDGTTLLKKNKHHGVEYKKRFAKSDHLKTHSHTGEKPFQCQLCEKSFTQYDSLKIHTRIHTGERPFACQLCEKSFARAGALKIHTRSHTGEKPYQCVICEKSFFDSSSLTKHARSHTGEKPYQCEICKKSFSVSSNQKKHTRNHIAEKPDQCEISGNSFSKSSDLKTHTRKHTGEKPYQCQICDKFFARSDTLKIHTRSHTGEKPYQCGLCKKTYIYHYNLNKHLKQKHPSFLYSSLELSMYGHS